MWWLLGQLCTCLGREKEASPLLPEEESGGGVDYGYAVAKNERSHMEDAVDIKDDVAGYRFFAVYDGHAGSQAVIVAKENLPRILGRYLQDEENVEGAIKAAFKAADEEVMQVLVNNKVTADAQTSSGTVACLGLLKNKEMWIANLGDCRAVVSKDGNATAISRDHAPEKNVAEAARLKQSGVSVEAGYVDEHVAVSRALGNVRFCTGNKVNGIMNEPEVFRVPIDDDVDFMMIGSDGIWDALKEQFALTHARKALRTTALPQDAALSILQNAGRVSRADNAAVIVIVFKFPEPLPKRETRHRVPLDKLQEPSA
ncbi:unnamed protein product [Symbiodinium natans]|uniref:PPM-type phosphatase domain-containing protein n=1 Tax=Symbiodinium natans TaxID=878477 RepID=A0A812SFQ7_9DINO|nr:unnamed protein product [Symbiodinium natans]